MCLIIMANDLKSLNYKDLETAYDRNSNGFGVMYMNKENKFVSDKFLPKNFNDVKNFFNAHKTQTNKMAIHFRFTTEGKTNKKNLVFENLTLAPIDKDLINFKLLSNTEKNYLFSYHLNVYSKLSKYLTSKEKKWLAGHF